MRITSLPRDMLVDVVTRIASESFQDLCNIKICCKDFYETAEDNYVLQNVSMDGFPLIQWFLNQEASSFWKRCLECNNIECLFREGLREYFKFPNGNINGLEILNIAAQRGHKVAMYVYGMILLSSNEDNELRSKGLDYLRILRNSKCIMSSRRNVQNLTKSIWKNNRMLVRSEIPLCNSKETCGGWRVKEGRWLLVDDEDDDIESCEACRWDHEIEFFYNLFN